MLTNQIARTCVVLLLLVIAAGSSLLPGENADAQEEIDISGEWTITLEGDLVTQCSAHFLQVGAELTATIDCRGFDRWTATGTIDVNTGIFNVRREAFSWQVGLEGSVASSQNEIGGTWSAAGALAGTFTGALDQEPPTETPPEPPVVNLIGGWNFGITIAPSIESNEEVICPGGIQQAGIELLVAFSCFGDSVMRGLIEPGTNRVVLFGRIIGGPVVFEGVASEDGDSLEGDALAAGAIPVDVVAVRKDRSPDFIDLTGTWSLELEPLETETNVSTFSDSCTATFQQRFGILAATIECETLGTTTFSGPANPISGYFLITNTLESAGGAYVGTASPGGNFILGVWSDPTRDVDGGFRALRTSGPVGDVNCDAAVNSIDAALVLQFDARLTASLACPEFADMNASQDITSIDAALILQRVAGLI
ncbi:MAG: dockerin type I repeat-containing protein [Chloroflexi bacterium]|nr:dockerin type I repeat-containing protein [Chloroflexota bacterium]